MQSVDIAEDELSTNSQLFFAYSLGLASCVMISSIELSSATQRLLKNAKDNFDNLPRHHQTSILFGLALFINLIGIENGDELSNVEDFVIEKVNNIIENFTDQRFQDSRVRFLYVLSSFPKCEEKLKKLYRDYKRDVEILREATLKSDEKALLLKPFSVLDISCHRTIITEIMTDIRKNEYSRVQKNILHRISIYFSYLGQADCDIDLKKDTEDNADYLKVRIERDDLDALNKLPLNARQTALIGICLITSGFLNVYVVPLHERKQYLQFQRSTDLKKNSIIENEKIKEVISAHANAEYWNSLGTSLFILTAVIILAYPLYSILQAIPLAQIAGTSILIIIYIIYQLTSTFSKVVSDQSRSILRLVLQHNKIKEDMRKEIVKQLGL